MWLGASLFLSLLILEALNTDCFDLMNSFIKNNFTYEIIPTDNQNWLKEIKRLKEDEGMAWTDIIQTWSHWSH